MPENIQIIVASAIIFKDNKVFIAKRADSKKFLPGCWEVPGGHVEFGESIEQAIIREVAEEIHVAVTVGDPCYTFTYMPSAKHAIEVDCFAQLVDPVDAIRLNPEDHSASAWISEDQISQYFSPEDWTAKAVKRAFEIRALQNR